MTAMNSNDTVSLGTTSRGEDVRLPAGWLAAHGLVVGASGAGKSYQALSLIEQMLARPSTANAISFGVLDAKGELFGMALAYLHACLYRLDTSAREELRKRVVVIDFSDGERIAPYNVLARGSRDTTELLVADRLDTVSRQFSGLSEMSVRMKMIATYVLRLMAEFALPLPFFETLCVDPYLLGALAGRSSDRGVRDYFRHRFDDESTSTLLALRQRVDSLLVSEGIRLSLSAQSSPDFAALQDQGAIILVNTAGRNIGRATSALLQGMILSDIRQSVFRRETPTRKFVWFFDEAQNLYKTLANREHMSDLLTMSRSFGSYFVLLTQSLTSAVGDADALNTITANARWIVMLRSTLRDASLIAPAIPLTSTVERPKRHPYEPTKYLTEREELRHRLDGITKLHDREAYLWLKGLFPTAVRIRTPRVPEPHEVAGCARSEFEAFVKSEPLGQGVPRAEVLKGVEEQARRLRAHVAQPARGGAVAKAEPERKGGLTLVRALEEEYGRGKKRSGGEP